MGNILGGVRCMVDFMSEAMNIKSELINIRRDIHENPELGFEEYRTSKIIQEYLKKRRNRFFILLQKLVFVQK